MHRRRTASLPIAAFLLLAIAGGAAAQARQIAPIRTNRIVRDADHDGIPDPADRCPEVQYSPGFDSGACGPMDLNPANDTLPECKARERVASLIFTGGAFVTNVAFAVVRNGVVHFADAFAYLGGGRYAHDPSGVYRLYRVGSTSKSIVAVAAKVMEERGELSFEDFVNDDDGTQEFTNPQRTLAQLLSHRGAFKVDNGAIHLFCYPGDLAAFWAEPDDTVSPHYDSPLYGNLGGGFEYSAFNFSLAGAYMAHRAAEPFAQLIQTRVFDATGMCTAMLDGARAARTSIGNVWGVSQAAVMHVGPYINLVSMTDIRCEDNFYSSDDLPTDSYSWQFYRLDEAAVQPRDPAGGVIASAIDLANFAAALLASYHGAGGPVSQLGIRDLWAATSDLGCGSGCPCQRYYGTGFFTDSLPGQPVHEVEHGGSRAGYATAFVLRPEKNLAVCILANADASTVTMSNVAKAILDDLDQ